MKKRVIGALIILATLITATGGALAWKANDIVTAYKPEIQEKLSQALGADVSVGDLSLSIIPRTSITISRVTVNDHTGNQVGLSVRTLKANAALLPLLSKRLQVSSILIEAPSITLRKEATGISISGLGKQGKAQQAPAPERSPIARQHKSSSGLEITIDSISVRKGQIRFEDATSGKDLGVNDIDLDAAVKFEGAGLTVSHGRGSLVAPGSQRIRTEIEGLTLAPDSATLTMRGASIESSAGKVSVSGSVSSSTAPGNLQIVSNELKLSSISNMVAAFAPQLLGYKPQGALGMKVDVKLAGPHVQSVLGPVTLNDVSIVLPNSMNLSNLSGTIVVEGTPTDLGVNAAAIHMRLQGAPLTLSTAGRIKLDEVLISTLRTTGFGGEIQAPSRLTIGSPMVLAIRPSIRSLSLGALLQVVKPDLSKVLSGTIVDCNADFQNITLTNATSSLSGPGNLLLKDGVIKGFNLPHQVLSNIDGLPFISGNLRKRVPPDFEQFVSKPDTTVKELRSRFSVENGVTQLSEFVLISDIFTLQSAGTVTFDGELHLDSEILFSPEFSIALTAKVKEFKTLLDGQQRLVVPLIVRGKAPAIVVVPNVSSLVQKATIGTVRETLGGAVKGGKGVTKSLGKILGF